MERLQTRFVDLPDARIAYTEHGAGSDLLLLHGNSESKRIFHIYQTRHFAMFHTIALDSRGHGETISDDDEYTIDHYSDDVIRFCAAKGITHAVLIGYSDGGNIALLLAKKAPRLFKRIIAISPNYLASGTKDGTLRLFRGIVAVLVFLGRIGFRTRKAIMRFNLMLKDIGVTDDELRTIRTPIEILYAEKDLIKEEHIQQIGRLIPGSSIMKILRCNHITIFSKKDTIEEMRRYLLER
jgi:pimeloyl-ACP methyl ester carboxylesterase